MATGSLTIDLDALARNWTALDRASGPGVETGAVVKADGYGLGAAHVARTLARAGARRFFVAVAEEGAAIREALGRGPEICVFGGHMAGDTDMIGDLDLIPMLNSVEQLTRHFEALPGHPFGIQLDTGMNRLGMEPAEWAAVRDIALAAGPRLLMSHLACADEDTTGFNGKQLATFREMTEGCGVPRSLSATGGILLGPEYHFDVTRPGIGLYGARPFADAAPVVTLSLPVIQAREVEPGEAVGYGCTWVAGDRRRVATVAGGYADGILRYLTNRGTLWADGHPCPILGRVSMDLITADITGLPRMPDALDLIGPDQSVDDVADIAQTIGYEVLTSLGARYARHYTGGTGP
ncbi:alanine racemase [Rhodovulum euryhalinum]|uniref:Alanine racemase n=1 Tax=Rhodovulum euryhalinum TaxID=35805 RepID=A0A4R2KSD8_9RHOB|nr:alanine racemase [Rhodovulum euryhalinum]TCO73068.1 alanine racemase [Rhodovulum euryhalinum]